MVFEDDFDREGQALGNGWTTNDDKLEQAVIKDGAMHISTPEKAGHRASIRHDLGFKNGTVSMKILLPNDDDTLTLDYADQKEKSVHAGHLFSVTFSKDATKIEDLKTGRGAANKAEKKKSSKAKKLNLPNGLGTDEWHQVVVTVKDDLLSVSMDGKMIGDFSSEGFAHPTKRMLRIAVPKKAVIDEVRIVSND